MNDGETPQDLTIDQPGTLSRSELDTHANMPVIGRHATILSQTGQSAQVNAYTPDYDPMNIPIVDAAIRYDCRFTGRSYLLIIRNALHVPSMNNNLLPPFVLREAGIIVDDVPKIHVDDPDVEHHSIYFTETGLRIPLSLWGVFSYFPSSKPSEEFIATCKQVYMLTPNNFNPHCDSYSENESHHLDWEGNMVASHQRDQLIFTQELTDDPTMSASLAISSEENCFIDDNFDSAPDIIPECPNRDCVCDTCSSLESEPCHLYHSLSARANLGHLQMSLGSTNANTSNFLVDAQADTDSDSEHEPPATIHNDSAMFKDVWDHHQNGQINLDKIMSIGAAHGLRS